MVEMFFKLQVVSELSRVVWFRCEPSCVQVGPDGHVQCGYKVKRDLYLPIYLIDFAIFYVTPLLVAIVLYALIARVLYLRYPTFPSVLLGASGGVTTGTNDAGRL